MRKLLALSLAFATCGGFGAASAQAIRPTTGFVLDPVMLFDSRDPGVDIQPGVERAIANPGDVVNVILANATADTYVYVHACGTMPDRRPARRQLGTGWRQHGQPRADPRRRRMLDVVRRQ